MNSEKRGEFLKKLRKSKKMTQQQLGELISYSDKNISKWENGYSFPTDPEVLISLSKIFKVSIEELLYGDYETKENKEKIKENTFEIYTQNYKEKNFLKKSIIIFIVIFLVTIIASLLTIYFVFIKGEIQSYKIIGESKYADIIEGTLLISNKINILDLNKIDTQQEIEYICFYTSNEDEDKMIFSGENDNYYIEEYKGSTEYELKSILSHNIFVKIIYRDGSSEIVKLDVEEKFINDKIFVGNISQENVVTSGNNDNLNSLVEQGFENEKDYLVKRVNNLEVYYYSNKFEIIINKESCIEKITKNIHSKNIIHEVIENDKIDTREIITPKSNDCDKKKCKTNEDYYEYLNFLSELIS